MKNVLKNSVLFFVLVLTFYSSYAQHLTKATTIDLADIVNVGSHSYIFSGRMYDPTIGDSTYITGCFASIIKIDDNMNVKDFVCFYDTFGTTADLIKSEGIMDMEEDIDSENLFITGTFFNHPIFGSDTLYPEIQSLSSIFLSKLDSNLNPIWAINNDFHNDWFSPHIGVKEMEVDGKGKVWLTVEVSNHNFIAFGNDTVYGIGTVVFDTSGVPVPSYYNMPEISDYEFTHMKRIDESRMLLLKKDLSIFTQYIYMMDTDADTILWKRPNSDLIKKVVVDTANNCYYATTHNGVLYKYDMMGNRIWHSIYNINVQAKDLAITENGDRVYVAAVNQDTLNTIYAIDSSGAFIDSIIWGTNSDFGNSQYLHFKNFDIDSNYLKIGYIAEYLDTLYFGNDTIASLDNRDEVAVLSYININQVLTSTPQIPELDKRSARALELFPNPNNGSFQIKDPMKIENIQLFNNLGQFVREVESRDGNINIEGEAGIYFLKVRYEDGNVAFGKVVKQ